VVRSEGDKIAVKFERDGKVQTVWVEPYKAEDAWMAQKKRAPTAHLSSRNTDH